MPAFQLQIVLLNALQLITLSIGMLTYVEAKLFPFMFYNRTFVIIRILIVLSSHRSGPGSNPGLVMWDFVMDKSSAGAGFLRERRFPLPIYIPSASPQSSSLSPEAGTIGQEWPQCQ
jgi:hypothetical protein